MSTDGVAMSTDTFPASRPVNDVDAVAGVPSAWAVGPSFAYPEAGLAELVWVQAIRRPDAIAVRQWERTLSYAALTVGARQVADALAAHGVRAESLVAVSVARRPAMVTALLGVLAAGGAYVPIDPDHPAERRDLILADARVSVAVVDAAGRRALAGTGMILVDVPDRVAVAEAVPAPVTASGPDNTAYVLFTSGSTGRPKGVAIAARSAVSFCGATAWACGVTEATQGIAFAALTFDVSVLDIFTVLLRCGTVCLVPEEDRSDPERLQRFLAYHEVTWGYLAPALLPLLDPVGLPALRCVIVGGEATGPEQVARWAADGRTFLNWYGPTEATVSVTGSRLVGAWSSPLPIGRPLPNHRCYVLDERLRPVAVGEAGELYVSGVGLARGYLDEPGLTAMHFLPDPFAVEPGQRMYRTGDQVRWEPDGLIAFLGRLDGQIKVRGQRVEVGEIETAIASHPSVAQAAVHLRRSGTGQSQLVAYVTPESAPDADQLRRYVARRLPGYMVPGRFIRLCALPLTSSSKTDFGALELEPLLGRPGRASGADTAWPTKVHAAVADAWCDVLDEEDAHPATDFVGAGGNSLLAMRLAAVLRDRFGCSSSVADIFQAETLGRLADAVAGQVGSTSAAGGPTTGSRPALTAAQRRLWFIDRLSRQTPAYNIPVAVRLRGPLDDAVLSAALRDVAADHAVLRWRVPDRDGAPYVEVGAATPVELVVADLTGADAFGPGVRDALEVAAGRSFDLASGPLWQATLLRLGPDDHVLAVTVHHIIFDGWSLSTFYRDLSRAYERRLRGDAPADAMFRPGRRQPEFTFADYAAWLEQTEASVRCDDRDWWRAALAGVKPVLDLPADRARPPVASFHGASVRRLLPPPVAAAVRLFARDNHLTVYAVMLAAFGVLLARLSGSDDLLVGAPVADRRHPAFDNVIGFFVDTLPVRLRVDVEADFFSHARACHDSVMNALAHRAVPFDTLVDDLRVPRDLSRNPLIQVLFNMYSLVGVAPTLAGVAAQEMTTEPPGSLFDVTLYVIERDDGLTLQAAYNPDLFDRDRMDALIASYIRLIDECLAAPHEPVDALEARPAVSDVAASWIAVSDVMANAGETDVDAPALPALDLPALDRPLQPARVAQPLPAAVARMGDAYPDRVAVTDGTHTLTHRGVSQMAAAITHGITARGFGVGDTVAVAATRTVELPSVLLGVLASGARWLLVDPAAPAPRRAALMDAADARVILLCEGAEAPVADVPVVSVSDMCSEHAGHQAPAFVADLLAADRGYYMVTSGTTGEPLVVRTPEAPLVRFLSWYVDAFAIGPADVTALLGGLTHDPLLRDAFTSLVSGGRLCVPSDAWLREPSQLALWLADQGVTILHLTPALGRLLCHASVSLPSVRLIVFAGDRLSRADVTAMRSIAAKATIVNGYGTTETPQLQAIHVIGDTAVGTSVGAVPIGRGINGSELHVASGLGAPATIGELGEVLIRGRNLATGYTDTGLGGDRFSVNGRTGDGGDRMFRTGDLGRYNMRGEVVLAGRRDGQVKIRGFRVELGEVEAALATHPDVSAAAAAVHTVAGQPWLVGYAVPRRAGVSVSALRDHVGDLLPDYACPVDVVLLPEIPLTRNGKIDRTALPAPATVRRDSGYAEAATSTERQVALVWRQVLGLPRVSVTANFFEIGGNSLAIVAVQARLLSAVGRRIELVDLFRFPNVRALAAHIDGGNRSPGLDRAARRLAAQRRRVPRQPAGPRSLPTEGVRR